LCGNSSDSRKKCSREILNEGYRPVLRDPLEKFLAICSGDTCKLECKCESAMENLAELMRTQGIGILPQTEGCDLYAGQLMLPASRQSDSRAEWSGPKLVTPEVPDLLPQKDVSEVQRHQEILDDMGRSGGPGENRLRHRPMTMLGLRQQMETRIRRRKWFLGEP
jgi:hypothetical protein